MFAGLLLMLTGLARAQQTGLHACPMAPVPRLRVGGTAVISPLAGQLNLRALPALSTGIVTPLYQGNRLSVIDGPSCNGHYWWWRVETINGLRGWAAEGSWERYYMIPGDEFDAYPARVIIDPVAFACPDGRPAIRPCVVP